MRVTVQAFLYVGVCALCSDQKREALNRSLELSFVGYWIMRTFGRVVATETSNGYTFTYVDWRGERYLWVR